MNTKNKLSVLVFAVLAVLGGLISFTKCTNTQKVQTTYSEAELKAFWAAHIEPVLIGELVAGKCQIPEVRERYAMLCAETKNRYKAFFEIKMITNYDERSHEISFGCSTLNDGAVLEIIMPKQIDIWRELQCSNRADWREQFRNYLIISFMHEMEHIVGDPTDQPGKNDRHNLIAKEKRAWARTIEYTIVPMVEKYHLPISPSDQVYYDWWVATGRSENSPTWEALITHFYGPLRDH